ETPDMTSDDEALIAAVSLDTGERCVLFKGGVNPVFVPTGHLLYFHGGSLIAVPFDPDRLKPTGPPATMLDGIMVGFGGPAHVAVANNGSIAYLRGKYIGHNGRFVWVDRQGRREPLTDDARVAGAGPHISPDGHRIAFEVEGQNDQIWVYDIERRTL